jgi:hypothetical protein
VICRINNGSGIWQDIQNLAQCGYAGNATLFSLVGIAKSRCGITLKNAQNPHHTSDLINEVATPQE